MKKPSLAFSISEIKKRGFRLPPFSITYRDRKCRTILGPIGKRIKKVSWHYLAVKALEVAGPAAGTGIQWQQLVEIIHQHGSALHTWILPDPQRKSAILLYSPSL